MSRFRKKRPLAAPPSDRHASRTPPLRSAGGLGIFDEHHLYSAVEITLLDDVVGVVIVSRLERTGRGSGDDLAAVPCGG
jgi:hypothetical protein